MNTKEEINVGDLLKKLDENGATGLDMSPGDELSALAAKKIRELQEEIVKLLFPIADSGIREDVASQAAIEMSKKGRDGAYLEIDVKDIVKSIKDGSMSEAKMIVLRGYRFDMSNKPDQELTKLFMNATKFWMDRQEATQLNDQQTSFSVIRDIFVKGLLAFKEEKGLA